VSPQFKEIRGWKIATPRANEPKGEWWSVFHDPELDQLVRVVLVSNQTVKADEAAYREALALINEARAGLFPTVNGNGSATRSSPSQTTLTAEATGTSTLDVWGQIRREIEAQQAFAETSAATLANATLAAQSLLALAYVTLREADSLESLLTKTVVEYKRSLTITQNQYNAGSIDWFQPPPRATIRLTISVWTSA
jgi:outer membrane protein TolC